MSREPLKPMNQGLKQSKPYLDSERYRQMLVRDGERRYQEWHTAFLEHQKAFRAALETARETSQSENR